MTQGVNNCEIFDEIIRDYLDNCVSIIVSTNLMLIYNLRVTQARCRRVGREVATAPIADYKVTTLQR